MTFLTGDATYPEGDGLKFIVHICNNLGLWRNGFLLSLSERWESPKAQYKRWHKEKDGFELGQVQFVPVAEDIVIANMLAQKGTKARLFGTPMRYDALEQCLTTVARRAVLQKATVHMPRIGCGLAGGKWELVEPIISRTLLASGIPVTVYDWDIHKKH